MKNLLFILFVLGVYTSCTTTQSSDDSNGSDIKARMQTFYDQVVNAHNVDMIDSFVVADFVDHNPDVGFTGKGIPDLKAQFKSFFEAFPDMHFTTNFMVAEGDTVVAHITMTGTNTGPMGPGMPATNKKVSISGIDIVSIKDGKAVERWGIFDSHKMMEDLGLMGGPPADTTKMEMK